MPSAIMRVVLFGWRFMTLRTVFCGALLAVLMTGCAGYGVYRIDLQQGNLITQEQLAKIKPGMSRLDVRNALGTPLLQDVFNANRWDFYFSDDRNNRSGIFGREKQRFSTSIFFENDKVARVTGEASPVEIFTGGGERRKTPDATVPGAPANPKKE